MRIELTDRQRRIVLQALTNFEEDGERLVNNLWREQSYDEADDHQKYVDEIHEIRMMFLN